MRHKFIPIPPVLGTGQRCAGEGLGVCWRVVYAHVCAHVCLHLFWGVYCVLSFLAVSYRGLVWVCTRVCVCSMGGWVC